MTDLRPGGFQQLPVVIKNLVIINVLMVLLQFALGARGIVLADYLGLHYWASPLFKWWQPFTHLFMHGDENPRHLSETLMHLVFNMFALWMFGRILENLWGPKRFLIFYFFCGLGAAICHMGVLTYEFMPFQHELAAYRLNPSVNSFVYMANHYPLTYNVDYLNQFLNEWRMNPSSAEYTSHSIGLLSSHMNEATVGASGAVFGVLFAFGYLFPNTEMMIIPIPIPIKAKWLVGGYAVLELYAGIQNSAGDNIAHFAHLGGMLFAFILLRMWKNKLRNRFY